ncbi:MAG: DNA polymerase III subunit alpha, partial [Terriglobales bacterium]
KKKLQEMDEQRAKFIAGARARGLPADRVARVFDLMAQFAAYGFNKSHAAAYAWVAYQTAYLKTHYRVEFMAAVLNASIASSDNMVKYIKECRDLKLRVEAPDVNLSGAGFTPSGAVIRFGLNAIKNVGEASVQAIVAARTQGPITDLYDLCERVEGRALNKRVLESLIKSGALDGFGRRAALQAQSERALEHAQRASRAQQSGQHGLFLSFEADAPAGPPRLPAVPDWDESERLAAEKEVLGYYVSGHPLERFADHCADLGVIPIDSLQSNRAAEVSVAGMVSQVQVKRNKKGEAWATAWLEDLTGRRELLCFAEAYRRLEPSLRLTQPMLARVRVLGEEGNREDAAEQKLQLLELSDLASATPTPPQALRLRLALDGLQASALPRLAAMLGQPSGSAKIHLHAYSTAQQFEQVLEVSAAVAGGTAFRRELEQLCGPGSVRVVGGEMP